MQTKRNSQTELELLQQAAFEALGNVNQRLKSTEEARDRWKQRYEDQATSTMLVICALMLVILALGWTCFQMLERVCK